MQESASRSLEGTPELASAIPFSYKEKLMLTRSKWLVSIISVSLAAVALAAAGPGYHVIKTYKVGGEGGWDYLTADSDARRIYISRGTHVMVIDADSG